MSVITDLDREDLVHLIKGTTPSYKAMDNSMVKGLGTMCPNKGWKWDWREESYLKYSEVELYQIYILIKHQ